MKCCQSKLRNYTYSKYVKRSEIFEYYTSQKFFSTSQGDIQNLCSFNMPDMWGK